jgi:dihydropteroate synthase
MKKIEPSELVINSDGSIFHLLHKGVSVLRVHDVEPARQIISLYKKMSIFVN